MSIHTILFDLDGTLIDTNDLIMASFEHTFRHYELTFSREEIMAFNGPPLVETFRKIDLERANEMIETYREHNLFVHDDYVKAFPNVVETVKVLKNDGFQLGVVTTKMRKGVNKGLALTGLNQLFDTIITLDDVKHAKPHPEPVIKALEALKATADTALMVGDNYHDILAGKNAGTLTAGVAWAQKGKESLLEYEPTYMFDDIRDILKITGV
ncbi:pyrophosphatase PpaX [Virgibacillus oceani]